MSQNPLVTDRELSFQLVEVHDAPALCALPYFSDHDRSTFEMTVSVAARFAREQLFPTYKAMDEAPPVLRDGHLAAHPAAHKLYPKLLELGILSATRPYALGGQQIPSVVAMASQLVLMAGNAAVTGYPLLTSGAVHLLERFADPDLAAWALEPMLSGRWGGTMALTEPHAGSSLGDITTQATPVEGRRYKIRGSKIFISAGEHDLTENIVHMTLARVAGAPPGSRGVSLFAVPKRRLENGALVPNDLRASQAIHKIGWRGLPSLVIDYVSERHQRIVALGSDNFLWVGTNEAGRSAATTLILVDKRMMFGNKRDKYLAGVLVRAATHPNADLDAVLPVNWKPLVASWSDASPTERPSQRVEGWAHACGKLVAATPRRCGELTAARIDAYQRVQSGAYLERGEQRQAWWGKRHGRLLRSVSSIAFGSAPAGARYAATPGGRNGSVRS